MPVAVVAVAAFASAAVKARGAKNAADAQKKGINTAKQDITDAYEEAKSYQDPYLDAGKQAIGQLSEGTKAGGDFNRSFQMSDFVADPGYQFRLSEGQKSLERSAAARGGALSGSAIKGAQDFGQNLASQEYQSAYSRFNNDMNTRFDRLSRLASSGQHAADVRTGAATDYGSQIGNLSVNKGNVNAANKIASSTAWGNAIGTIGNAVAGGMGGSSIGSGGNISDYTSPAYSDWLARQGGGSSSYRS